MVRPPSQAPRAFPTLKAAMLIAEAIVGASPPYFITRVCRGGTVAKPKPPSKAIAMIVGIRWPATKVKPTRMAVRAISAANMVPSRCRSAALPPTRFPANRPIPKISSSHGTVAVANPETSVTSGAM